MSKICLAVLALTVPGVAAAQTPAPNPAPAPAPTPAPGPAPAAGGSAGWSRTWEVKAAPTFGADRAVAPFPIGDEIVDDSEFSARAGFRRSFRNGASLTLVPGASYSPNQFDAEEPASALSLATTLKAPITRAVGARDALSWFVSYGIRADFDEAFEDYVRTDQTFGLGIEFTNVLTTICDRAAPRTNGECTRRDGWKYTVTPSLNWVESTEAARERFNPSLTAAMEWPTGEFSSLYLEAAVDRRLYERVDAPDGEPLRAMRYAATAGVDLSGWTRQAFNLPAAFSFRLGVRWAAVSSNDPTRDSDQVYIVPELGWKQTF
jgi:hypothetical protein